MKGNGSRGVQFLNEVVQRVHVSNIMNAGFLGY